MSAIFVEYSENEISGYSLGIRHICCCLLINFYKLAETILLFTREIIKQILYWVIAQYTSSCKHSWSLEQYSCLYLLGLFLEWLKVAFWLFSLPQLVDRPVILSPSWLADPWLVGCGLKNWDISSQRYLLPCLFCWLTFSWDPSCNTKFSCPFI
jgi:hypothetical protein